MGTIYAATDETDGTDVAIKLIHPSMRERAMFVQRFEREASIAESLRSRHIIRVLATGVDDEGWPYMVMERLQGEDLSVLLGRIGPLPVSVALRIAAQACLGLVAAHATKVVHRDIKPSNLYLARDEAGAITVKLLDFGIAKLRDNSALHVLTQTGAVLGSPFYMSPEQARGSGTEVDERADLWSLGIVLYQALCGQTPHQNVSGLGAVIIAICTQPAPNIQDLAPWVPPGVASAVKRMLAPTRDKRFPTATDLARALAILAGASLDIHERELVALSEEERKFVAPRAADLEDVTVIESGKSARTKSPSATPDSAIPAPIAQGTPVPDAPTVALANGPRVLIVEDNPLNMDMLSRRLAKKGYRVLTATDGDAGIATALAERPDVILMDVGLPGTDGLTAVKTLRASDATRTTPIIAITAHATPGDRERALAAGCDDYETKPIELARLLEKLVALLGR